MRGMLKGTLVLVLALGLASVAQAQRQGFFAGPGGLLMNPAVQKELKLTDDQVGKVKEAIDKVRDNHKDDIAKLREMSPEDRQKLMTTVGEESQKAIAGILNAKQMKRFLQIQWQATGGRALGNPRVQKALKLSEEQKSKLKTIFEENNKKMRELLQGGRAAGAVAKFQELRKEMEEMTNAVLTDEQKKTWKEMKGQPFELQRPGAAGR